MSVFVYVSKKKKKNFLEGAGNPTLGLESAGML